MRRVTFTKPVTLAGIFGYELATETDVEPRRHEISFEADEVINLHEWGWTEDATNFSTDDDALLARVRPGDSTGEVFSILGVPYDCHESEPAGDTTEEPFRAKAEPYQNFQPTCDFSGFNDQDAEEELHSSTVTARTA